MPLVKAIESGSRANRIPYGNIGEMWSFGLVYFWSGKIRSGLERPAIEGDSPVGELPYGDFRVSGVVCVGYHA